MALRVARTLGFLALALVPSIAAGCGARTGLPYAELTETIKVRIGTLHPVDKVDLLLVIDNSLSMADKQSELGKRLPELVRTLTKTLPDPKTGKPKTRPVLDLHVGVITSSLGSHGTSACAPDVTNPHNDDRGHLLPRAGEKWEKGWVVKSDGSEPVAVDCPTTIAATPISWVFDPARDPAATYKAAEIEQMQAAVSCVVESAQEDGCSYEETWEAMYHFLVDPAPYASAQVDCTFGVSSDSCGGNKIVVSGLDEEILAQRKAFLRPDSVLAVIVLSDENDQSLKPVGLNWKPWGYAQGEMRRGWAACEKVPDDFEPETKEEYDVLHAKYGCWSCSEDRSDPNCKVPWATDYLNQDIDGRNMRGVRHIQRFGYSFFWSRQRYVDAFTKPMAVGSDGKAAPNPIFVGGRTSDLIIVAAIVGVPTTLVANADGTPKELTDTDWAKLVGPVAQRDPHMIESIAPRDAIAKYAGDRTIDPSNGGERDITDGDDLQYACIGKRTTTASSSECRGPDPARLSPLCEPDGSQPYLKAYPGLRHLRIVRDLGFSGYAASICAGDYTGTVRGIIDRVQVVVDGRCLRTKLAPDTSGDLPCALYESFAGPSVSGKTRCEDIGSGYCTPGAKECRQGSPFPETSPYEASKLNVNVSVLSKSGLATEELVRTFADGENVYAQASDGTKHLVCEVMQLAAGRASASEAARCRTEESFTPSAGGGWCYTTDRALVTEACLRFGSTGTLRFFGATVPKEGSELFAACAP